MRFVRKLSKQRDFASISIPKAIFDCWNNVEWVEFLFDEENDVLVLTPFN